MSRTIPVALQTHLDGAVTTTCRLLRIALRDGRVFGVTSLDADVTYDDGRGEITYSANQGVDPSAISADADLSVANAEAQSLLVTDAGITEAMIEAGDLRDAEWTLYLVNYRNLANGHAILGAGDVGEVTKRWGLVWMPELLSYSVRLRQPIGTHWSRTCRAIFGSDPEGQTGCGVDAEALWVTGTVSSAGAEADRQFTGSVASGAFVPGRVEFTSGPNTGRVGIVESFAAGVVTLANTMPYPITAADAYRIRPDCARTWAACVDYGNQLNFKGEPLIPTGDAASVSTPGAQARSPSVITQIATAANGAILAGAPATPPPNVPLNNPAFATSGGWTVTSELVPGSWSIQSGGGRFGPGFLRWQSGPQPNVPLSQYFGDVYTNTAVAQSVGETLRGELWCRCVAASGDLINNRADALLCVQTFEDAACTIPIGPPAQSAGQSFAEVGTWRLLVLNLSIPAGRYFKLCIVARSGITVTLEFDDTSWNRDLPAWNTRGIP